MKLTLIILSKNNCYMFCNAFFKFVFFRPALNNNVALTSHSSNIDTQELCGELIM
jgi:hypothetical protein